jgi:curved DNA-binding protein CbpA
MADRDAYEVLGLLPTAHNEVIQAAYRALAALHHPDAQETGANTRRMAELNDAYAKIRSPERRALYDAERRLGSQQAATSAGTPPTSSAPPAAGTGSALTFGRYQGWTIDRLAKEDPDYLRWLSRHSSGLRYKGEIEGALKDAGSRATAMNDRFAPR